MRLHSLTLRAIGPFAGRETINFDALGAHGRFLLTGPTGAGKSTIIDAVVFALYGQVAGGDDSTTDRMRSRHARPDEESFVELTFSTGAGTYKVWRSPAFERAKKRGSGTTSENARVQLWRLAGPAGGNATMLSSRPKEVGTLMSGIIGLSREQFTQTIVLPQGKFATFLKSTSDQRHDILRDVFGTRIYDAIQDQLEAQAREANQRTATARQVLSHHVEALTALLPEDALDSALFEARTPSLEEIMPALDRLSAQAAATVDAAAAARDDAKSQHDAALAELTQGRELSERLRERAELLEAQAALASSADAAARERSMLARADAAAQLWPLLQQADVLSSEARSTVAALHSYPAHSPLWGEAVAELEYAVSHDDHGSVPSSSDLTATSAALTDYAAQEDELRTLHAQHAHAEALEANLPSRKAALAQARNDLEALHRRADGIRTTIDAMPPMQREALEALAQARSAADSLPGLEKKVSEAKRLMQVLASYAGAQEECGRQASLLEDARAQAHITEDQAHHQRQAWIATTASHLSSGLTAGQPCPVCGSCEHPHPAPTPEDAITQEELESAEAAAQSARHALEERAAAFARAQAALEALSQECAGATEDSASQALAQALAELTQAQAQALELPEQRARHEALLEEERTLRATLEELNRSVTTANTQIEGEASLIGEAETHIATARGDYPSVTRRREDLATRADALRQATTALHAAEDALTAAMRASRGFAEGLEAAGMQNTVDVRQAYLEPTEHAELRTRVRERDVEEARITKALAQPRMAELSGEESVDLPDLIMKEEAARRSHLDAVATHSALSEQARHLAQTCGKVAESAAALVNELGSAATIVDLAAIASGRNDADTPLSSWVLTERFREVILFANERLEHMSDGRYELVQTNEEKQRARYRGLGLGVIDRFSPDRSRDPKSLSGGETFYVSLALALALADVVAAHNGGTRMDTLFIDEGFGSLDPSSLSDVLAELSRLEEHGRAVGIISHVEELRRQIPDQIRVTRSQCGSHLTVVAGA